MIITDRVTAPTPMSPRFHLGNDCKAAELLQIYASKKPAADAWHAMNKSFWCSYCSVRQLQSLAIEFLYRKKSAT